MNPSDQRASRNESINADLQPICSEPKLTNDCQPRLQSGAGASQSARISETSKKVLRSKEQNL